MDVPLCQKTGFKVECSDFFSLWTLHIIAKPKSLLQRKAVGAMGLRGLSCDGPHDFGR